MKQIYGVYFRKTGRVGYFHSSFNLKRGQSVVVKTQRGLEFGEVIEDEIPFGTVAGDETHGEVVRVASEEDFRIIDELRSEEKKAEEVALSKIKEHNLDMKLVEVEYLFDRSKIIFYFTAEGRVDFRSLVKDLAGALKKKIELRQIGVRDEARIIGGLGPCGRDLCCATYLQKFEPVSIKMAREQGLPLNPMRISGLCGRLMCCLQYEHQVYVDFYKKAPPRGTKLLTEKGEGEVVDYNVPAGKIILEYENGLREERLLEEVVEKSGEGGEEKKED